MTLDCKDFVFPKIVQDTPKSVNKSEKEYLGSEISLINKLYLIGWKNPKLRG